MCLYIGYLLTVCMRALQAQHVGHRSPGDTAEEPPMEGVSGPYNHTEVLFCCPRIQFAAFDCKQAAAASSKQGMRFISHPKQQLLHLEWGTKSHSMSGFLIWLCIRYAATGGYFDYVPVQTL